MGVLGLGNSGSSFRESSLRFGSSRVQFGRRCWAGYASAWEHCGRCVRTHDPECAVHDSLIQNNFLQEPSGRILSRFRGQSPIRGTGGSISQNMYLKSAGASRGCFNWAAKSCSKDPCRRRLSCCLYTSYITTLLHSNDMGFTISTQVGACTHTRTRARTHTHTHTHTHPRARIPT